MRPGRMGLRARLIALLLARLVSLVGARWVLDSLGLPRRAGTTGSGGAAYGRDHRLAGRPKRGGRRGEACGPRPPAPSPRGESARDRTAFPETPGGCPSHSEAGSCRPRRDNHAQLRPTPREVGVPRGPGMAATRRPMGRACRRWVPGWADHRESNGDPRAPHAGRVGAADCGPFGALDLMFASHAVIWPYLASPWCGPSWRSRP